MKLKSIKTEAEAMEALRVPLNGRAKIEVTVSDGSVASIRIGGLHLSVESYNFKMRAEVERETVNRQRLTASIDGFPDVVLYFETLSEAYGHREKLPELATVKIDEVQVEVDGQNEVIKDLSAIKPEIDEDDDLPF